MSEPVIKNEKDFLAALNKPDSAAKVAQNEKLRKTGIKLVTFLIPLFKILTSKRIHLIAKCFVVLQQTTWKHVKHYSYLLRNNWSINFVFFVNA